MSEQTETRTENTPVSAPVPGGMMLRKRVKDGKKFVKRMVYVERPQQSKDPLHNKKRDAKRTAQAMAKEHKAQVQKEIKNQMSVFDMRFILASMNKFAPAGWRFVTVGNDNRIAMQSTRIMGNQSPRGAFVSDISFDLIYGVYGDLFYPKQEHANTNLYEQMKFFQYEKPSNVPQDTHDKYIKTIKGLDSWDFGMMWPMAAKHAPTRPMLNKNAALVQGVMDSGNVPPAYLNNRMHKIVNETVWWAFRRALLGLTLERLQHLRKVYRTHMTAKAVIPGKKISLTSIPGPRQRDLESRLDNLIKHVLPQAIAETNEQSISLHRQMAQLAELQPTKFDRAGQFNFDDGIKPSKKLRHQIHAEVQRDVDDWCSGFAQKQRVKEIKREICKTIAQINGAPMEISQPARGLMPKVFFVDGDTDVARKINDKTSVLRQIAWLTFGRIQKTK